MVTEKATGLPPTAEYVLDIRRCARGEREAARQEPAVRPAAPGATRCPAATVTGWPVFVT
jgi:hypothetical protein